MTASYIDLINNFWQKDNEHNFSTNEVALYFYILKSANAARWKNPIGLSNAMAMAKFRIGKTAFDTAKRNLKNAGLIDFNAGSGRGNVCQYTIMGIEKVAWKPPLTEKGNEKIVQKQPLSDNLSNNFSPPYSDKKPETSIDIEKEKEKEYLASNEAAQFEFSEVKGNETGQPIWETLVRTWFAFYRSVKHTAPTFDKTSAKKLKDIAQKLESRTTKLGWQWDAPTAAETLQTFLHLAYKDKWLSENFLLKNLDSQFDKVITNATKNNTNNGHIKQMLYNMLGDTSRCF